MTERGFACLIKLYRSGLNCKVSGLCRLITVRAVTELACTNSRSFAMHAQLISKRLTMLLLIIIILGNLTAFRLPCMVVHEWAVHEIDRAGNLVTHFRLYIVCVCLDMHGYLSYVGGTEHGNKNDGQSGRQGMYFNFSCCLSCWSWAMPRRLSRTCANRSSPGTDCEFVIHMVSS